MTENPALKPDFDALAADLRRVVSDRPIAFAINPGNWGDALIREGAERFLRHYGFAYTPFRFKEVRKKRLTVADIKAQTGGNAVLVYNGCGAFTEHYPLAPSIAALAAEFEQAVVLPSTFAMDVATLAFPPQTVFYVRDRFESQAALPDAMFCHDMAFFIDWPAPPATRDVGYFLRRDFEQPDSIPIPRGNRDLSAKGQSHDPIDGLMTQVGACRTLHTNRLHIGIAGALMGREVHLYPNDYFKIRAIHRSTLAPHFPNVKFKERFDLDVPRAGLLERWWYRGR